MATLSGQTVQSTYQGLLKFADSTTGITSSFQAIQDGLGNDTGIRIKPNEFDVPNLMSLRPMKGQFYGNGQSTTGGGSAAQNLITATAFIDIGVYSYSAISINITSATTTSDTFELGFYGPQWTSEGIMPGSYIFTGITASTSTIGQKTFVFPSPISFSGTPGLNFLVQKISNSGVTPTVRYSIPILSLNSTNIIQWDLGFIKNFDNAAAQQPFRTINGLGSLSYSGVTDFESTFNPDILVSGQSSTLQTSLLGFVLHTI